MCAFLSPSTDTLAPQGCNAEASGRSLLAYDGTWAIVIHLQTDIQVASYACSSNCCLCFAQIQLWVWVMFYLLQLIILPGLCLSSPAVDPHCREVRIHRLTSLVCLGALTMLDQLPSRFQANVWWAEGVHPQNALPIPQVVVLDGSHLSVLELTWSQPGNAFSIWKHEFLKYIHRILRNSIQYLHFLN